LADYDAGKINHEQLKQVQDEACRDSIERMEATGSPIVSDGEQRASSFATYPLTDTLGGTGLAENLAADGQYFAVFADGHYRQLPRLVRGPFRYKTYAAEFVKEAKKIAKKPLKQAVIAPSMLSLLYPLDTELPGYSRDRFLADLCDECEKDIRQAFAAGAARVSIDFTEGRLACRNDPNNPWTGRGMLNQFIELNNRVIDRFSAAERKNIGIHTCPGGDCDSTHSADVDYAELLPTMFKMNAGYFLIQMSSERDRERAYKLVGQHSREDANGVRQVCFIGVIDPLNPRVETPEEIADQLMLASKYIPLDRLGSTDDCGFSPFSIDKKPKHGSPDMARDIAFQKITARVKGTQMASDRSLGQKQAAGAL
jgi:methionine synthase II (cobalamin-independent)